MMRPRLTFRWSGLSTAVLLSDDGWAPFLPITRSAREEPWGLHEMHVTDPDGVTLIFVQVPETHPLRRDTRN